MVTRSAENILLAEGRAYSTVFGDRVVIGTQALKAHLWKGIFSLMSMASVVGHIDLLGFTSRCV